jgi:SAM-dependent methyltransferase
MEDYFEYHSKYLPKRTEQVRALLSTLSDRVNLAGNTVISVGCGVASEFSLLDFKQKIGIDFNPRLIEFCTKKHIADFVCDNYMAYFESLDDNSVDLVLALDIDTNIIPSLLVKHSLRVLKPGGSMIVTERENNIHIYGRMLLLPFIDQIKQEFPVHQVKFYSRMNHITSKDDRDNFVLTVKKL